MPIEQQRTVEVLKVEVGDDYQIELTATDVLTGDTAVVSLTHGDAQAHVDEVLAAIAESSRAIEDFKVNQTSAPFPFDVLERALGFRGPMGEFVTAICRDCQEGKHGACIGSAHVENGPDIDEVECRCPADGHRGRS